MALGLAQMLGATTGWHALRTPAALSLASPAPRVFSAVAGFEVFAARTEIAIESADGSWHQVAIEPAVQARARGPFLRRSVYAAALAYGWHLQRGQLEALWHRTMIRGFCAGDGVGAELGLPVPPPGGRVVVRLTAGHQTRLAEAACPP